jgi:hypothetical protein
MAEDTLPPRADFTSVDMRLLEEIGTQVNACRTASEKAGRAANVLTVFLKMTDEKTSAFVKQMRDRLKSAAAS